MATKYFDKVGAPIEKPRWIELQNDAGYRVMEEYDNGTVHLELVWLGAVDNPQDMLREYWPMFKVKIWNYDSNGRLREDPQSGDTFGEKFEAEKAYREFLERWTASYYEENSDGTRKFVEEDNLLTPPPPPDPNRPVSIVAIGDDGVDGAW